MSFGLVLPFSGQPFESTATLRAAVATGVTDVWLRDWPRGQPAHADYGTGHDPLLYACHLDQVLPSSVSSIGFAVLRLEFREPEVLARSVVSLATFGQRSLRLGIGARLVSRGQNDELSTRWQQLRELLDHRASRPDFILPSGYERPPFYLCSSDRESWSTIDFAAEGWLAGEQHPRDIASMRSWLSRHVADLDVVMQVQIAVDLGDRRSLGRLPSGLLECGTGRLRQLARAWRDSGVDHVVYRPPPGTSTEQLAAFADTLAEVKLECAT